MKIVIPFRLPEEIEALVVDENVVYRPDLATKGRHAMRAMMLAERPDMLIERCPCPGDVLGSWRDAVPRERRLDVIHIPSPEGPRDQRLDVPGIGVHDLDVASSPRPEVAALEMAESINVRRLGAEVDLRRGAGNEAVAGARVVMVGGGIVNLITAYYLARQGCRIDLYDGGPDPCSAYEWRRQGCTFGGGDARIFSLNEGRHHHHKGFTVSASTNDQFQHSIAEGGWLSRASDELNEVDRRWIEEFERVPQWLSGRFDKDIISFNQESNTLWRQMMIDTPELFAGVGFRDGLLRLYATGTKLERAKAKETAIGAMRQEIDLRTLVKRYPSLRDAVESGSTAGALEVVGFSLNVHKFGRALVRYLSARGVAFHWGAKADRLIRDDCGRVSAVAFGSERVTADHFVISAGAFGRDLLAGFQSHQKIAPVIGMWLMMPDEDPKLDRPLKISRSGYASEGAAEGANVISGTDADGRDVIHVSGGHGYMGSDLTPLGQAALVDLARAVHETAQDFFPRRYGLARDAGLLDQPLRYCIRPWTPSGLGVFETAGARGDGLAILTGGHNTGGFAQSPSVARAVTCALRGEGHRMHALYHPRRFGDFASTSTTTTTTTARGEQR